MNKFSMVMKLGSLIGFGLSASAALAEESPNGHTYKVTVFRDSTAQFSQFNDCFTFDNAGNLTIKGYGTIVYRQDQLNTQPEAWQAPPKSASIPHGVILSFHGIVGGGHGQTIVANGNRDYLYFTGGRGAQLSRNRGSGQCLEGLKCRRDKGVAVPCPKSTPDHRRRVETRELSRKRAWLLRRSYSRFKRS